MLHKKKEKKDNALRASLNSFLVTWKALKFWRYKIDWEKVILLIISFIWWESCGFLEPDDTIYYGDDNYTHYTNISVQSCQNKCTKEERCAGISYVTSNKCCNLYEWDALPVWAVIRNYGEGGEYVFEVPSSSPTSEPTPAPSDAPTEEAAYPGDVTTLSPTSAPTDSPSDSPTLFPTMDSVSFMKICPRTRFPCHALEVTGPRWQQTDLLSCGSLQTTESIWRQGDWAPDCVTRFGSRFPHLTLGNPFQRLPTACAFHRSHMSANSFVFCGYCCATLFISVGSACRS